MRNIDASVARGDGNAGSTAVRDYTAWCHSRGVAALRPIDLQRSSYELICSEVWHCLRFVDWLIYTKGVSPATAKAYLGTVNMWHFRRCFVKLAGGASLAIVAEMAKGAARLIERPPRPPRYGLPTQVLAMGMDRVIGPRGLCGPTGQNLRAGLTTCFATLSRGCELFLRAGSPFTASRDPQRADLQRSGAGFTCAVHEAKRCSLTGIAPGKRTRVFVPRGASLLDPAAELEAMLALDPGAPPSAPLFRDASTGQAITVQQVRDLVKAIAHCAGLDPANYGAHSLRRVAPR